jgi:hypothetical protein
MINIKFASVAWRLEAYGCYNDFGTSNRWQRDFICCGQGIRHDIRRKVALYNMTQKHLHVGTVANALQLQQIIIMEV